MKRIAGSLFFFSLAVAGLLLLVCPAVFHAAPQDSGSGYRVLRKIELNADGNYDYTTVDPVMKRVYIPRNTHIQVLDEVSGKIIADIPDMAGLHGVAVADEFNVGAVTGNEGTPPVPVAYMLDLKAMKVTSKIPLPDGKGNDSLEYDSASKRFFLNTAQSNNVQAIDAKTQKLVGMVTLPGRPEAATPDGKGHMFVNIVDKNKVTEYDGKTLQVMNTWDVSCDRPYGIAYDGKNDLLFVGCRGKLNTAESDNKMVILNAKDGSEVTSVPLCVGTDGTKFDEGTRMIWNTCRDNGTNGLGGQTRIYHQDARDKYTKVADIATIYGSRTIGLDPKTHHIWTAGTTVNDPPAPPGPPQGNGGPKQTMTSLTAEELGK